MGLLSIRVGGQVNLHMSALSPLWFEAFAHQGFYVLLDHQEA